ncbi:SPL family radical SAM protein [Clostridium formicaceticum]|uniref:Radical SAM protein n=1 Tax=Clostridium formicaceticum TaxID=1497 RepID=A0AAC9RNM6_9CLOT|nr:radical SAM protein [Clostridium formicaceticum]AOY74663.1 radical SAM protein [Clostridium formicaceticum]ARE89034.1 Radical SAM superfamily protein [Clostridium formicaceticum]
MIQYAEYKTILSKKNNMNIYRGCTHGCIYCDARSECYGMTYTFENIEVKTNAVELLDQALSKKREKCMITTGAMTDPYIPLEKELKNTRKCLEVMEKYGFGVCLLTKSDLVLRDIDILKRINQKSKCVVQMTLTTYDEELCKILEPNVCGTKRRFEVLIEMHKAGIPTVVWLTPILPFINDNYENISGILDYCKQAKITGLLTFGIGMTLRYGNREYYYQKLDDYFPNLKKEYIRKYGSSYGIKSPNNQKLTRVIKKFCKDNNIIYGEKEVFRFCTLFPEKNQQIALFDV